MHFYAYLFILYLFWKLAEMTKVLAEMGSHLGLIWSLLAEVTRYPVHSISMTGFVFVFRLFDLRSVTVTVARFHSMNEDWSHYRTYVGCNSAIVRFFRLGKKDDISGAGCEAHSVSQSDLTSKRRRDFVSARLGRGDPPETVASDSSLWRIALARLLAITMPAASSVPPL